MRKITQDITNAFTTGNTRTIGNSHTDGERLYLHGHVIAERWPDGRIFVTLAGWPTPTTRERLNGLCQALGMQPKFRQKNFKQYYGDRMIGDHQWVKLTDLPTWR